MKMTLFATAAMAALLGPMAFSAQKPAAKPTPAPAAQQSMPSDAPVAKMTTKSDTMTPSHELSGRILSVYDNQLIVSHGTKKEDTTFVLNPETKREGKLTAGEMVKVEYWTKGKENIATVVQVDGLKSTTPPKTKQSSY
jgi:hypothetical protein